MHMQFSHLATSTDLPSRVAVGTVSDLPIRPNPTHILSLVPDLCHRADSWRAAPVSLVHFGLLAHFLGPQVGGAVRCWCGCRDRVATVDCCDFIRGEGLLANCPWSLLMMRWQVTGKLLGHKTSDKLTPALVWGFYFASIVCRRRCNHP
jgi:hypothetical protein